MKSLENNKDKIILSAKNLKRLKKELKSGNTLLYNYDSQ